MTVKSLLDSLHLRLAPRDEEWFVDGWQTFDGDSSVFSDVINPEESLANGAHLWGGLMLPDTVPILGDGAGNCLCARFGHDGTLSEVVAWDHEGGHWRHYGYSIDQALVLNRVEYALTEKDEEEDESDDDDEIRALAEISPVALNEMECKRALESRLETACLSKGGGKIAKLVGVGWNEFAMWLRDTSLIPRDKVDRIVEVLRIRPSDLTFQNWAVAIEQARLVLDVRNDLAWPYAVAGWGCERQGQLTEAIDFYQRGLMTLGGSSAFTGTWTDKAEPSLQKFAAQRLRTLADSALNPESREYVSADNTSAIRNFWVAKAMVATERHDHASAYRYFYSAGWDSLIANEMEDILQAMKSSAEKAGFAGLASLASLHLESF